MSLVQVGGLGDVVTGLARTCLARGHRVTVMMPFYECLPQDQIDNLKHEMDIDVPKGFVWDGVMQVGNRKLSHDIVLDYLGLFLITFDYL